MASLWATVFRYVRVTGVMYMKTIATPTRRPPSGYYAVYMKNDGLLYKMDSAGVESLV